MRIDLPRCNFKNCRYCFDSNCIKKSEYERCEYRRLKADNKELKRIEQKRIEDDELWWERELLTDKDVQEREAFERLMGIAEMTEGE